MSDTDAVTAVSVFTADWCGPCQQMKPVLDELEDEYDGEPTVTFERYELDDNQEMARERGIKSIPTVVVESGDEQTQMTGTRTKAQIKETIETYL